MMTIMSDLPARSPSIGERIGDVSGHNRQSLPPRDLI